jgi:hypothetical protein
MTIASLIVNVAANQVQLVKDVEQIQGSMDKVGSIAKKVGGALASAFTIGAITAAIRSFTELTGSLTDLSAKTGIGVEGLQKLKYAAEQNGGSLDAVTAAVTKMGANLANGNTSAVSALKTLGLSFDTIRNMSPEDAFIEIGDAIGKIQDPMAQAALAVAVFGKSGADNLPMFNGHLKETIAEAERLGFILDTSTIAAGDHFGDTLNTLQFVGSAVMAKLLIPMLPALQALANAMLSAGNVVTWLQGAFSSLLRWGLEAVKFFVDAAVKVGDLASKIPGLSKAWTAETEALKSARDASQWLGGAIDGLKQPLTTTAAAVETLRGPLKLLPDAHAAATKATKAHTESLKEFHLAVDQSLIPSVQRLGAEVAVVAPQMAQDFAVAIDNNMIPVVQRLGVEIGIEVPKAIEKMATSLKTDLLGTLSSIPQTLASAFTGGGGIMGGIQSIVTKLGSQLGSSLGFAIGGPMGASIGAALGSLAGTLTKYLKPLWDGIMEMGTAGKIALTALIPPLGIIALFAARGRGAVKDFAESFGGFDPLHAELLTLGDEGERLWIKLTQGVDRNSPAQAKKVIDEITAALDKQKETQAGVQKAAEDSAVAQTEAQTAVITQINGLTAEYNRLWDSIKSEAPEEVMGVVEEQTRARMDSIAKERENAIESLKGLTDSLSGGFDEVLKKLDVFIDRLGHIPAINIPIGTTGGAIPMATGGDFMVNRPTLFLAGEAGPERATFTPKGQGRGGGGGGIQVLVDARGATKDDADAIAEKIMRKLRQQQRLNVA